MVVKVFVVVVEAEIHFEILPIYVQPLVLFLLFKSLLFFVPVMQFSFLLGDSWFRRSPKRIEDVQEPLYSAGCDLFAFPRHAAQDAPSLPLCLPLNRLGEP